VDDWRAEEVSNQIRFRDFNEWIKASNERLGNHRPKSEYLCECSDLACRRPILLTPDQYESVRAHGAHFLIVLDHENPEVDRVLAQHEGYTVVAKFPQRWERMALAEDPRQGER
jgi:hypothetical protein